ncbi:MAG: hypothetical protein AB7I27_07695 [Bacteriovoracaceae bacterium]
MEIRNQQGQTVVEYILLLSVVISLVVTFYNSQTFKKLFGTNGAVGLRMKANNEFGYRHAYLSVDGNYIDFPRENRDGSIHPSYYDAEHGETRFFGPKDTYE